MPHELGASLTVHDLPEIVQRYRKGESMLTIAAESLVCARTLYRWMLTTLGPEAYYEIQTECLLNRVADADVMLMQAQDSCQVARAREIARFARFDLERRRPEQWGQKQPDQSTKIMVIVNRDMAITAQKQLGVNPEPILNTNVR